MIGEVNILGAGKIGIGIVDKLSEQYPTIIFNLITRNKEKLYNYDLYKRKNVNILNYDDNIRKNIICFYCISSNEQEIIKKSDGKEKSRILILKENMKIAYSLIPFLNNISPSNLFVISNPLEAICFFLKNKLKNINIYGLGLELDSRRFENSISILFGNKLKNNLYSLGNHTIRPIPILSNLIGIEKLQKFTLVELLNNLKNNSYYKYKKSNIDFYEEFYNFINNECLDIGINNKISLDRLYDIIIYFSQLLIKSEFDNNKPPVDNPIDSIVETFNKILSNKIINLSYYSNNGIFRGGIFKFNQNGILEKITLKISNIEKDMIYSSNIKLYSLMLNILF